MYLHFFVRPSVRSLFLIYAQTPCVLCGISFCCRCCFCFCLLFSLHTLQSSQLARERKKRDKEKRYKPKRNDSSLFWLWLCFATHTFHDTLAYNKSEIYSNLISFQLHSNTIQQSAVARQQMIIKTFSRRFRIVSQ